MTFTWFRRRESTRGLRIDLDREELCAQLRDPAVAHDKHSLPLVCFSTFEGDRRGNDRVEAICMLGLDIDEPQADPRMCIETVAEALGDVEVYAYSTMSSVAGATKLRVAIPYERTATASEHCASWSLVARLLARHGVNVDRACSDPARGFYVWARPSNGLYFHEHINGAPWPVGRAAEIEAQRLEIETPNHRRYIRTGQRARRGDLVERARRYVATMPAAISGSGGHRSLFNVARRLVCDFELCENDARDLLYEYNERCHACSSSTTTPSSQRRSSECSRLHDVVAVATAAEGLARLSSNDCDVVLCDMMMPQMTGMAFHEALRLVRPEYLSRVVFVTGGAYTPNARDFLGRIPNRVVDKPFERTRAHRDRRRSDRRDRRRKSARALNFLARRSRLARSLREAWRRSAPTDLRTCACRCSSARAAHLSRT